MNPYKNLYQNQAFISSYCWILVYSTTPSHSKYFHCTQLWNKVAFPKTSIIGKGQVLELIIRNCIQYLLRYRWRFIFMHRQFLGVGITVFYCQDMSHHVWNLSLLSARYCQKWSTVGPTAWFKIHPVLRSWAPSWYYPHAHRQFPWHVTQNEHKLFSLSQASRLRWLLRTASARRKIVRRHKRGEINFKCGPHLRSVAIVNNNFKIRHTKFQLRLWILRKTQSAGAVNKLTCIHCT